MEKLSQKELHQKNLLNHLQFLEQPFNDLEVICPNFKTTKQNTTEKYEYLKNKLNDLVKIKTSLELESQILSRKVNEQDAYNKEIAYELKIAKKDRDEVIGEKIKVESELTRLRVLFTKNSLI
jgi:FixJ family two-component response regulator